MSDWQLIVVDDNDPAARLRVQALAAGGLADPRITWLENDAPAGAARARNRGLHAARGRYVTYLDDDDAYAPDKLQRQFALAESTGSSLVLCGATYHLRERHRRVQCAGVSWRGDDLLTRARWGSPFLFHRRVDGVAFDERLMAAEDLVFAHDLLARFGLTEVPVVPASLIDVYPQPGVRVNATPQPWRPVAKRVLRSGADRFSREARRRFILQLRLGAAKIAGRRGETLRVATQLLRASRGADWRFVLNAVASTLGWGRGRWVT